MPLERDLAKLLQCKKSARGSARRGRNFTRGSDVVRRAVYLTQRGEGGVSCLVPQVFEGLFPVVSKPFFLGMLIWRIVFEFYKIGTLLNRSKVENCNLLYHLGKVW